MSDFPEAWRNTLIGPVKFDQAKAKSVLDYGPLRRVLELAVAQAESGKGADRHSLGLCFLQQPIMAITRHHGVAFATGQAAKKGHEAALMVERKEWDRAKAELLGSIVYSAAAFLVIDERSNG